MQHTMRRRMQARLVEIKETLRLMLHVTEQGLRSAQAVFGHLDYRAVTAALWCLHLLSSWSRDWKQGFFRSCKESRGWPRQARP
jgi:hypothetical protein